MTPAYVQISSHLRELLSAAEHGGEVRLPTEAELTRAFGVSRQTVRRAYAELVDEGLVERAAGRGSFPTRSRRFLMSVDSVDDLLAVREDRELQVLTPLGVVSNPSAATKLGLPTDDVGFVVYRLVHDDSPFALNQVYLPPKIASTLSDVGYLQTKGAAAKDSVIALLDRRLSNPVAMARQLILAVAAPQQVADAIGCEPGEPMLSMEFLYFDTADRPVQLNVNYYHPDRYEYRAQLLRRRSSIGGR